MAGAEPAEIPAEVRRKMLRVMLEARLCDEAEQALKRRGLGHFQLSGTGHEGLVGVAMAMREEDWLHPHYRDRAIVTARGIAPEQFFLDFFAKRDSVTGGRQMPVHFNNRSLRIVSLSSPVATQIVQAAGMAMSLRERKIPEVVVAAIGDAATREGEVLEAIAEAAVENLPLVLLIEDNRYGISTPTEGKTFWTQPHSMVREADGTAWFMGCRVEETDGVDPEAVFRASKIAIDRARFGGGPTCLVARVERLCSHSSSDDQKLYRSEAELECARKNDPVRLYETRCIAAGLFSAAEIEQFKSDLNARIERAIETAKAAPDPDPATVRDSAFAPLPEDLPTKEQGRPPLLPKRGGGLTMAQTICLVLEQEMARNPRIFVYGEDIEDPKGDVFGTTKGLSTVYPGRVRNSPLAENTIIGSAVGRACLGDVPVAAIQFVDFMGPGLNQLFNEVITMHWRSQGQWNCPMLIMAPYGAYLPGLGPWHSQTNEAVYAHMPGLHVVIPSNPGDAAGLLRFALRCNRPVLYLYPKALLHGVEETVKAPGVDCLVPFGKAATVRAGRDVTLVTWGNCVAIAKTAAQRAVREGIETEIIDLRTVAPWDRDAVLASVHRTGRLLVVHEDAKTCGLGGDIIAETIANAYDHLLAAPIRVTKSDDHNPYQYSLELSILPSVEGVLNALRDLSAQRHAPGTAAGSSVSRASGVLPALPAESDAPVTHTATNGEKFVAVAKGMAPLPQPGRTPARPSTGRATAVLASAAPSTFRAAVRVPKQSPTDEDATVVRYLVEAGEQVKAGTLLAEMEANKGTYELESPYAGKVLEFTAKPGERVNVNAALIFLQTEQAVPDSDAPSSELSAHAGHPGHSPHAAAAEAPGGPHWQEVRLSQAQLQVGALALRSQLEIPTVSIDAEADLTALMRQRNAFKASFKPSARLKVPPTLTHCILWALVRAMVEEKHQGFRGRLSESGELLLVAPHASVGFAATGPKEDLYSPVVKDASRLAFPDLVRRASELTESVRTGSINSLDLQGATVTLTNIGSFEAVGGTPFVIPGQVAMLCAGSLLERPRYVKATPSDLPALELRQILALKLVFDHRPFNGSHAAAFLRTIKHNLEAMNLSELMK